jgi:hypothetical protein
MKPLISSLFIIAVSLTGCASHYYQVKNHALYFYLKAPDARKVEFAHSKDGFTLHRAEKIDARTWRVRVPADSEFTYFYLVDDTLFPVPCQLKEKDDFGFENCIFMPDL